MTSQKLQIDRHLLVRRPPTKLTAGAGDRVRDHYPRVVRAQDKFAADPLADRERPVRLMRHA